MPDIRIFVHRENHYLSLNGLTFQALRLFGERGYNDGLKSLFFAQLAGASPLTRDDLPDNKLDLLRSRQDGQTVWTVWRRDLVNYESEAASGRWLFCAPTHQGCWVLALRHLARRSGIAHRLPAGAIARKATEFAKTAQGYHDLGSSAVEVLNDLTGGERAVLLRYDAGPGYQGRCTPDRVRELFGIEEK